MQLANRLNPLLTRAAVSLHATSQLVQSPLFNRGVARAHGTFTELSESAYAALERATCMYLTFDTVYAASG